MTSSYTKIIHQIVISNSNKAVIPNNYKNIKKYFVDYKYMCWNYKKIKDFILKNNDKYVIDAIDSINANSFKADIAKYYILYKLGGWYSDANNFFIEDVKYFDSDFIFFKDENIDTKSSWAVASGLFYSTPKNIILKYSVDQCVKNINEKYYGAHALCPTGPNLFGSIIAKNNLPENNRYLIENFKKTNTKPGYYIDNKIFAEYKPNNLKSGDPGFIGSNNYADMWESKILYK